jgi:hypothetical protein
MICTQSVYVNAFRLMSLTELDKEFKLKNSSFCNLQSPLPLISFFCGPKLLLYEIIDYTNFRGKSFL